MMKNPPLSKYGGTWYGPVFVTVGIGIVSHNTKVWLIVEMGRQALPLHGSRIAALPGISKPIDNVLASRGAMISAEG